jgi:hypothetical protein
MRSDKLRSDKLHHGNANIVAGHYKAVQWEIVHNVVRPNSDADSRLVVLASRQEHNSRIASFWVVCRLTGSYRTTGA